LRLRPKFRESTPSKEKTRQFAIIEISRTLHEDSLANTQTQPHADQQDAHSHANSSPDTGAAGYAIIAVVVSPVPSVALLRVNRRKKGEGEDARNRGVANQLA
jgi:hypothetical protein